MTTIDLEHVGFDGGAHVLVNRALAALAPDEILEVTGTDPHLEIHLAAWARSQGHRAEGRTLRPGPAVRARWRDATRAGGFAPTAIAAGWDGVARLEAGMHEGRARRLARLGFPPDEADELAALHTRNFM